MIDLSNYRVIDLSYEQIPGERKIDGTYTHGTTWVDRPIEVQEFMAYGARMHFIQAQTHLGTHCEAAYKYLDDGPDAARMPLESFLGEAVFCDFSDRKGGEAITAEDFGTEGVKAGDGVLIHTDAERKLLERGIPTIDALYNLAQIRKKRVCFIALPVKMQRVTASWTRAIALEEKD